ncbi:MAG: DEAD/DEAH box helicase [Bowdeniella nasicola]|nr:DEAD/DEAH box helicase [Bowdeniella nasicola]
MATAFDLVRDLATHGEITHVHESAARPARFSEWPSTVHPEVRAAYERIGISQPWTHQAQALRAIEQGRTTVLATDTGSGKSLPVWASAFSALTHHRDHLTTRALGSIAARVRRPTTLYLAPTKALAADQLHGARGMIASGGLPAVVATADGDTSQDARRHAQARADIVLSNPDFVHFSMLARHERWARLLGGLHAVVLDEAHAYRGLFGAHVALVLRRLLRVARHYGADPTVVFLSATTADPAALPTAMLGPAAHDPVVITDDGAPTGVRRTVLWRPVPLDADEPRRPNDPARLLTALVAQGERTLAFVRSRNAAESLASQARDLLRAATPAEVGAPRGSTRVAAYRGGYLPEERRALESDLRSGRLQALTATNALELGIDVAGLDAVLICGWPGSRASLLQQAGRSGRAGRPGLAVFVAREDPLDTYLTAHPEAVFSAEVEPLVIDPTNPHVLLPHLCAAASEVPLREEDYVLFGLRDASLLASLAERGLLKDRPQGWMYNRLLARRAHDLTDLRGAGGGQVSVIEEGTGALLGTVDAGSADGSVHPGAIYLHQGRQFRITRYDGEAAIAEPIAPQAIRTTPRSETRVEFLPDDGAPSPAGSNSCGVCAVRVTRRVTGYERRRMPEGTIISSHSLDLPERALETVGAWWHADPALLAAAGLEAHEVPGALHGAEHALIGILPLIATCERADIGGVSMPLHPDTLHPTIVIYDGAPGGAGFAARGAKNIARWVALTRERVVECRCADGCPSCIVSPKCGTGNDPLSKAGARAVLGIMAEATSIPPLATRPGVPEHSRSPSRGRAQPGG